LEADSGTQNIVWDANMRLGRGVGDSLSRIFFYNKSANNTYGHYQSSEQGTLKQIFLPFYLLFHSAILYSV